MKRTNIIEAVYLLFSCSRSFARSIFPAFASLDRRNELWRNKSRQTLENAVISINFYLFQFILPFGGAAALHRSAFRPIKFSDFTSQSSVDNFFLIFVDLTGGLAYIAHRRSNDKSLAFYNI